MIHQTSNPTSERIKVIDFIPSSKFRKRRSSKLKGSNLNNNRLPVLAYNRHPFIKPRIDLNELPVQGRSFWVSTNLLPKPNYRDFSKVEMPIIEIPGKSEETDKIHIPSDTLSIIEKQTVGNNEKGYKNRFSVEVSEIKLPVEVKVIPAIVENSNINDIEAENLQEFDNQSLTEYDSLLDKEVFDLQELLILGETVLPFLVEDLIPEGKITILAGPSDTGKSTFALQIAISIIQGKSDVIGKKITARHSKVIYISTEDGPNQVGRKLQKQLDSSSRDKLGDHFRIVSTMERLKSELQKSKVDLVIIDTLPDFFRGEINSATAVREFFNDTIKPLIRTHGCTFLILHHIGKNKSKVAHKDQLVGSQSIEAASRQVLYLVEGRKRPLKELKIVKGNYVSYEVKKEQIVLELDSERLLFKKVEKETSETKYDDGKNPYSDLGSLDNPPVKTRRNSPNKSKLEKAMTLDAEGYTLEAIAKELGYKSTSSARNLLIKAYGADYNRKKE